MNLKQQINRIKASKDAKTLIANFAWLSALQFAGYLFPLVTMPYLAKVIGVEGFGKIAFAAAVMVWIQTVADWGFNFTATRDIAQNRENKERVSEIFSNVLWARCFLMICSFILLMILIVMVPQFNQEATVLMVTFLVIPGHILFPDWFFQAVERMKYITILNVFMKFLFTIAVFLVIKKPEDYIFQPLLMAMGYMICGLIALYLIIVRWQIRIRKPIWSQILATLKGSSDVFVNTIAPTLYNSFSIVLLGLIGGGTATGFFDGGNKFVHLGDNIMHVLSRAFFPFLARKIDHHHIYARIHMGCACCLALALFVLAPYLIRYLLSPEFMPAVIVLRILAVSIVFLALSNIYGANYLLVRHRERVMRNVMVFSSLCGLLMGYPLIAKYSYVGAALTIAISRMLVGILMAWYAHRVAQQSDPHC